MKIKAMVDGVERDVELNSEQMMNAAHAIDKLYDEEDFDHFMEDFFGRYFEEEDREMIINAKDDIVCDYNDYKEERTRTYWWEIMDAAIYEYILDHKQ